MLCAVTAEPAGARSDVVPLREATRAWFRISLQTFGGPAGQIAMMQRELVDERTMVNACVALLASGGSTNHTMHLVAMARAAGIELTWQDLSDLSAVVPSLCRIYPNGSADVNHFQAAGGIAFLVRTLLDAGLLHEDVLTVTVSTSGLTDCAPRSKALMLAMVWGMGKA